MLDIKLTANLDKVEIQPKIFKNYNSIEVIWQWNRKLRGRWGLNNALLLQEDVARKCKINLEKFFKINNKELMSLITIWEAK